MGGLVHTVVYTVYTQLPAVSFRLSKNDSHTITRDGSVMLSYGLCETWKSVTYFSQSLDQLC